MGRNIGSFERKNDMVCLNTAARIIFLKLENRLYENKGGSRDVSKAIAVIRQEMIVA